MTKKLFFASFPSASNVSACVVDGQSYSFQPFGALGAPTPSTPWLALSQAVGRGTKVGVAEDSATSYVAVWLSVDAPVGAVELTVDGVQLSLEYVLTSEAATDPLVPALSRQIAVIGALRSLI